MKAKLKYTFFDPNIAATTEAILAICMECIREKAKKAVCAAVAECGSKEKTENVGKEPMKE